MPRRQTVPSQWLIVAGPSGMAAAKRLRRGSGVLLLKPLSPAEMRRLRLLVRQRGLALVTEAPRRALRVHDQRELRAAMLARTPLVLLSPMFQTRTHPGWDPLPRMRAAALARLGGRKLLALGGMDARRFAQVKPLGFQGWAGISAFRT